MSEEQPSHGQPEEHKPHHITHAGNERLGLDRLIFFSDAIFAIAITLLAIDIQMPPIAGDSTSAETWQVLASLWPDYAAYITSFIVIGLFWAGHHRKFRSIVRYDHPLLWLNLLLLMTIAFIPFPTRVMSDYDNSATTIFYAAVVATAGILAAAISAYAVFNNRLANPGSSLHHDMRRPWRVLAVPAIFLISIPIAVYEPQVARLTWILLIPASWQ